MQKQTLLYFIVGKSTFTDKDLTLFLEEYQVYQFNFLASAKWKTLFLFVKQFFFLLKHISSAQIMVSQFSGYHSFLPALFSRLTGKPFLIIAGGTDCHSFPEIRYGNFQKRLLSSFTKQSYKMCTHISPKHATLWESEYNYSSSSPAKQGIKAFIPELNKPHTIINNGYNSDKFQNTGKKIPHSFLTVAGNLNYPFQLKLKGIDLFLQLAEKFADCSFTLVGVVDSGNFMNFPKNIKFLPPLPYDRLIELYTAHTFYVQLSMAEGFPNTLCESMLCECVPIGSNVFSIPEIIGQTGFILERKDLNLLHMLIEDALKSDTIQLGKMARERIAKNYPLSRRRKELLNLCRSLEITTKRVSN